MVGGQYVWCWLRIGMNTEVGTGPGRVHNVNHVKDAAICLTELKEGEEEREEGIREMVDTVDMPDGATGGADGWCQECGMKLSVVAIGTLCGRCV